jgi:uncharacterized protein YjiS (DUF1127 family)
MTLFNAVESEDTQMSKIDCSGSISWPSSAGRLPTWRDWLTIGARKLVKDAAALVEAVAAYNERAQERYALCTLDDRMMKDIGVTRADIWLECSKPFWRP